MDMQERVAMALAKIEAMSEEEFLAKLIEWGYKPEKKESTSATKDS